MAVLRRWVLLWTLLLAGAARLWAATEEENAFNAAYRELHGNSPQRADEQFGRFIQVYTNSTRLPEAILRQAQARLLLGKAADAVSLLSTNLPQAGRWTDHYLFWLGKAFTQQGDYHHASDTFGQLLQKFPASTNRLEASVEQAAAGAKLGQWSQVIDLLQQTNGVFQSVLRAHAGNEVAQRGLLLLSQAWLRQTNAPQQFEAAEAALQPLANLSLKPEVEWQRQNLLCRIWLGSGRTNEALQNTTNLLAVARQAGSPERQADSFAFRAGVIEGLGRLDEAIAAYTNNLAEGVPAEAKRQALLKSAQLWMVQGRSSNALQTLERFVGQDSNSPAADVALLTLGELNLGQSVGGLSGSLVEVLPPPGPTNAIARLQELVQRFPQSPYRGKAQLLLGWCFYLQTNWPAAQTNFQAATQALPASPDQAVAYFKLADTQCHQGDVRGGLANYSRVLELSAALPGVGTNLQEAALYQTVYAGLAADDLGAATNAMLTLLARFPDSYRTAPAVLLAGQALGRQGNPARAREIFLDFAGRTTNALPLVQLALARTWEEEGNWTNAIRQYSQLLTNCPDQELRAEAEFYRAQATWRAGDLINALMLHTNFVGRFSWHTNAPIAQFWVGGYYFTVGNFSAAEINFQSLCENNDWRGSGLVDLSRMMAGRAAFQQQLWKNATNDFIAIAGNANSPLWAEATFAYGDCDLAQLTKDRTDPANVRLLDHAISVFSGIYAKYPTGPQGLLALGRKADTLVLLAQYSPDNQYQYYTNALATYQSITNAPEVNIRSIGKMGLYAAYKMQADQKTGTEQTELLHHALDQCLDVVRGTILGAGEKGDPDYTLFAGEKAINLAEGLQEWSLAVSLCDELAQLFPFLKGRYLERKNNITARQTALSRN